MAVSVIRNIMEIEDVSFLKMSCPVVAETGHARVSSEWTQENRAVSEIRVFLVN
jgi:hypothetical protein